MNRRTFLSGLTLGMLGAPLAVEAQKAAKITRIGYLPRDNDNPAAVTNPREAFLQALRDLGYVEDRNLVIEYRSGEGKIERLPALAAELVALRVDVIVAPSTVAALAAKQTTRTVPIVCMSIPVTSGLVTSLARPGGNVTGLAFFSPGVSRQVSGTAQAGHSGGQSGRCPLAARGPG